MKLLKKIVIGLLCAGLGVCVFTSCQSKKDAFEYDEREFQMYMEENELLYEQKLREEERIPSDVSVKEYLGDAYTKEMEKENEQYVARRKAVQILAEQYCDIEPLDYDELLEEMEKENDSRAEKIAAGEVVYGVRKFDISQFMTYYWDELETSIVSEIAAEMKPDQMELEEYYQKMSEPLYTDGEKVIYYLYSVEGEQADIQDLQQFDRKELAFSFQEIKDQIRKYGIDESIFLNFDKEQVDYLGKQDGQNLFIQFERIQKDPELSEEELALLQNKMAEEKYEKELESILEEWDLQ